MQKKPSDLNGNCHHWTPKGASLSMVVDKAIGVALWGASFRVWDASSWEPWQYLAWAGLIVAGLELMALLVDKVHTQARAAAATANTIH